MFSAKKTIAVDTGVQGDFELANYLDFLATKTPIERIAHLHLLKSTSYALPERIDKILKKTVEAERMAPLLGTYRNVRNLEGKVTTGKLIPELEIFQNEEKATLIAVGKGEHTLHTAKNLIRHVDYNILVAPKKAAYRLNKILVPVDLSEHSGKLMEAAISLQEQSVYKFEIICYHAYEIPDVPYYNVIRTQKQMHVETQEIVQNAFNTFIAKHDPKGAKITPVLYEEANSWPSHYILKYINEHSIDLVIMGTHSHGAFDALMGSTVEKVISKNDKCPMLIIK